MDKQKELAELIFPDITKTIEDYEKEYPERNLPEGACVTRFAPSPTGFMHLGGFFQAIIDYLLAKNTNGVFYLRNEDTDQKREVEEAVELIMTTLKHYGITPSEYEYKGEIVGNYGPYIQSERKEIYHTFIKHLIEIGKAYPCFCTKEKLDEIREIQDKSRLRTGYYGKFALCRKLTVEEMIEKVKAGEPYVIRFKSEGNFDRHFDFDDLVRGKLSLPQNDQDLVIMKSDNKLPTYHFAHFVDDYLMKTTHVVRGEEWIPSAPIHIELFRAFGVEPPKYIHTPLIVKKDGDSIRKLSKRKDPEATMSFYEEHGYPPLAVIESLLTIINSNYEQWHTANPDKSFEEFVYDPKKMSAKGGALYDMDKLDNISKNYISKLTKDEVFAFLDEYTKVYDKEFNEIINKDIDYTKAILNIEREQKKPRKDYAKWEDVRPAISYMFDELFDPTYTWGNINDINEIKTILDKYVNNYYNESDDKETWFNHVKELTESLDGYTSNMKAYKENPDAYKGNVADVSTVIRVALTGRDMTPDLYEIMKLLGKDRIVTRINNLK